MVVRKESYKAALQARNDSLKWGPDSSRSLSWSYPPEKRTHLVCYDYRQGGIWVLIDARSPAEITEAYPELEVVDERPEWLSPAEQWRIHDSMHFDIDEPVSGWLAMLNSFLGPFG